MAMSLERNNNNSNSNYQGHPMKYYQSNTASSTPDSQAGLESPVQQSRCYLCDIPKQDYSLTRSFSELICRGCLNYEGSDRIEQLIAAAYQFKKRQVSPVVNATASQAIAGNGNNIHKTMRNGGGSLDQQVGNIRDVQAIAAYSQPIATKQIPLPPLDTGRANVRVNSGLEVERRATSYDGSILNTTISKTGPKSLSQKCDRSPSGSPTHSITWENQTVAPELQNYSNSRNSTLTTTTTCETRPTRLPLAQTSTLKASRNNSNKPNMLAESGSVTPVKNITKNSRFPSDSTPAKQTERYSFDSTSAQVGSNQEISSNKPSGFRAGSSPRPLEMHQAQLTSLSQQFQAPIDKTTHDTNRQNHQIKEAEAQMSKEKVNIAHTKQSSPVNMNYAVQQQHQQQQQMLAAAAAFDPMHMVRTPACGAVDHLVRLHQQHFPAVDNTNLERELARLQSDPLVGSDGSRRANQLDTLPDCNRNPDSLQRFIQDPNTALSLQLYAASSMSCCGSTYFVQQPPPPPPPPPPQQQQQQQQQQQSNHSGSLRPDGVSRSNIKQNTPAPSSSLYAPPYPYAMAPYMASNGAALFCPPQYHPYHYHPHPSTFQSTAYGNILSSAGAMAPNSQCFTQQAGGGFDGLLSGSGASSEKTLSYATGLVPTSGSKLERRLLNIQDSSPTMSSESTRYVEQAAAELDKQQTTRTPVASPEITLHKNGNDGDRSIEPEVVDADQRNRERNTESIVTINDKEDLRTSNTLIIQERDRDSRGSDDRDTQQQSGQAQTRDKQSFNIRTTRNYPTDPIPSSKSRGDGLHYRPSPSNSPTPAKRPAIEFSKTGKSLNTDSDVSNSANRSPAPPPSTQPIALPSPSLILPTLIGKTKSQTSASRQQPATRRSQGSSVGGSERSSTTNLVSKTKHINGPAASGAAQGGDGLRQLRKALDADSSLKTGHELNGRNVQTSAGSTNPTPFHNENSSDRNSSGLNQEPMPVSISSTTSPANRNPVGQELKQTQQQQQLQTPSNKYSPLKCLSCQERLEDRHFVQCPSVMAHKFCFACSKKSIERQQLENKNLGNGFDRVFCPSGRRCFLATEQTPWTFMNSEIETIFRESSRVNTSSNSASGEAPNLRSNSSASPKMKSKHNGRADDEFEVRDKVSHRSSSRLPAQSKPEATTDSNSQKVGSMSTHKVNKVN